MFAPHVAAEDRHAADAGREREERLPHRIKDGFPRMCGEPGPFRREVELQALLRAGQRKRLHGQHAEQHQQRQHHSFREPFHAALHAKRTDHRRDGDRQQQETGASRVVFQQRGEIRLQGSAQIVARILEKPSRDIRVVDHQQEIARKDHAAGDRPEAAVAGRRQFAHRAGDAAPRRASHRQFRREQWEAEQGEEEKVHQHERRAAVLSHDKGETPHVPETDGASRRQHQEPEPRTQLRTFSALTQNGPSHSASSTRHRDFQDPERATVSRRWG